MHCRSKRIKRFWNRGCPLWRPATTMSMTNVAIDLNNLARLLSDTNRPAEAEPFSRRHLRIFAEFAHRTGYVHRHFQAAINNYFYLLSAMGLSQDAIAARVRSAIEGEPEESA